MEMCYKCGKHEATETYAEDTMSWIHGMSVRWCKGCVLSKQLEVACERAAAIPELVNELCAWWSEHGKE